MSRIARVALAGVPYHVTQRGNGRQQVFFSESDHNLYLDLLAHYCAELRLKTLAYCVMPNHIHLIVVPQRDTAMAQALGRTHAHYARHYNLQHRTSGHVWQARYYSTPLDAVHLWRAMAYIERNPVRARLVEQAEEYAWSSVGQRRGAAYTNRLMVDLTPWAAEYDWPRWKHVLATTVEEEAFGLRLQEASRRGRPVGDETFVLDLESRSRRSLRPRPVGRPRKDSPEGGDQLALGNCV